MPDNKYKADAPCRQRNRRGARSRLHLDWRPSLNETENRRRDPPSWQRSTSVRNHRTFSVIIVCVRIAVVLSKANGPLCYRLQVVHRSEHAVS